MPLVWLGLCVCYVNITCITWFVLCEQATLGCDKQCPLIPTHRPWAGLSAVEEAAGHEFVEDARNAGVLKQTDLTIRLKKNARQCSTMKTPHFVQL